MNWYPPEHWVVLVPGYLGRVLHPGIHMQPEGSIARGVIGQKRVRQQADGSY